MSQQPEKRLESFACPFCRGDSRVYFRRMSRLRSGYFAECLSCGVRQGKPSPSIEAAVAAWNRRAPATQMQLVEARFDTNDALQLARKLGLNVYQDEFPDGDLLCKLVQFAKEAALQPAAPGMEEELKQAAMLLCADAAALCGNVLENGCPRCKAVSVVAGALGFSTAEFNRLYTNANVGSGTYQARCFQVNVFDDIAAEAKNGEQA